MLSICGGKTKTGDRPRPAEALSDITPADAVPNIVPERPEGGKNDSE